MTLIQDLELQSLKNDPKYLKMRNGQLSTLLTCVHGLTLQISTHWNVSMDKISNSLCGCYLTSEGMVDGENTDRSTS